MAARQPPARRPHHFDRDPPTAYVRRWDRQRTLLIFSQVVWIVQMGRRRCRSCPSKPILASAAEGYRCAILYGACQEHLGIFPCTGLSATCLQPGATRAAKLQTPTSSWQSGRGTDRESGRRDHHWAGAKVRPGRRPGSSRPLALRRLQYAA